jgi:hypothetical protein
VRLLILKAANPNESERAFSTLAEQRCGALLVGADTFYIRLPELLQLGGRRLGHG